MRTGLAVLAVILVVVMISGSAYFVGSFVPQERVSMSHSMVAENGLSSVTGSVQTTKAVNPYSLRTIEPAPMGIADYGIGPNNQPYEYNTSSFLAKANVYGLQAYNSSQNAYGYNVTFQLNVVLTFNSSHASYVYWVQEGPNVNTQNNSVSMWVNVFNESSASSIMSNSSVSGNGTIYNGTYLYNDPYIESGNYANLKFPYTLEYKVNATVSRLGSAEVMFYYNDGYGWVNFDSLIFNSTLSSWPRFVVNGNSYLPNGYMFYDAEWVLAGFGNSEQVQAMNSNLTMQLEYFNGHNYQMVSNAYNFGSNTAEGISNVTSSAEYYLSNGTLFADIQTGPG